MLNVYFNLLHDDEKNIHGFMPERSEKLSTGYDVRNAGPDILMRPFQKALIPLGFRAFIPEGWYFELYPRSSTFHKKSIHSLYGVIDESYSNYWFFACQYIPKMDEEFKIVERDNSIKFCPKYDFENYIKIEHGDRIAQIILRKRYDFCTKGISDEEFDKAVKNRGDKRGLGGFGSTGDK